jgi:hypothetical protein
MSNQSRIDDHEKELSDGEAMFETALGGLSPLPPDQAARDRMLYLLGQQSGARRALAWRNIAAVFAIGLAADLVVRAYLLSLPVPRELPSGTRYRAC